MQLNRLFETVFLLLNRKTVTAAELSERFGVSVRTIYRDLDILSVSGIPVCTRRGKGGGISLLDNFVLDRSMITAREQNLILSSLEGLNAAKVPETGEILERLSALFRTDGSDWIRVDFSSWGPDDRERFDRIRNAILEKRVITFSYYNSAGEKTFRSCEPLQLYFRHRAWYLKAWCLTRDDFRLFKLSRMMDIGGTDRRFVRSLSDFHMEENSDYRPPEPLRVCLLLDATQAYRVFDEFRPGDVARNPDGSFTVTATFVEDEWTYGYLLSFGHHIRVTAPERVALELKNRLEKTLALYSATQE